MPIDLTQPAAGSSLSSAVIRSLFAEVAAELDLKAGSDNPNITGSLTLTDGGGFISGIGGSGGFAFLQGSGATIDKRPQVNWYQYAGTTDEHAWAIVSDVSVLRFTAVNDAFSTYNDFMTVSRSGPTPGSVTFPTGITTGSTTLLTTNVAQSNAAAAATATLTNAPVAGNPTKWMSINDNGTVRRFPTW